MSLKLPDIKTIPIILDRAEKIIFAIGTIFNAYSNYKDNQRNKIDKLYNYLPVKKHKKKSKLSKADKKVRREIKKGIYG